MPRYVAQKAEGQASRGGTSIATTVHLPFDRTGGPDSSSRGWHSTPFRSAQLVLVTQAQVGQDVAENKL